MCGALVEAVVGAAGLLALGVVASTFIHEGGHALAATLCGWQVEEIQIGPPPSAVRPGIRIGKRLVITSVIAKGQVVERMVGPFERWRYRAYAAGGMMANLLVALVFIGCTIFLYRGGYLIAAFAVAVLGVSQAVELLNLCPVRTKAGFSDGYAIFYPERAYAYRMQLRTSTIAARQ